VVLDADVAEIFRDSESVNIALRQFFSEHGAPATAEKHSAG
jgi:hypothetical protein